jgi:hypothetical protein
MLALTGAGAARAEEPEAACTDGPGCMTADEAAYITTVLQASIEARDNGLCHDAVIGLELAFVHYPDPRIEVMIAECLEEIGQLDEAALRYRSVAASDSEDATPLAVERLAALAPALTRGQSAMFGDQISASATALATAAAAADREADRTRRTRIAIGSLLGATIALGATSTGFALAADDANDDVRAYDPSAPGASREDLDQIEQKADRDAGLSNAALAAAALTAGATIGLFTATLVDDDHGRDAQFVPVASAHRGGFSVGVHVRF